MQRQRGELVPIGEALADLPGPVQALIPSRSTLHHFTQADQVNQLVSGPVKRTPIWVSWRGSPLLTFLPSLAAVLLLAAGSLPLQAQGSTTYYFPHLAVGASWQTTITYINYSPEEVTCQTDFISDHGSPLMVSFAGLGPVVSRTDVLPPGGSVHQETNVDLSAPLAPGWARATCSGPVKASLLFRQHNSAGVPIAEGGVNAAAVPATRFVTFAEQAEGKAGTGVAYANLPSQRPTSPLLPRTRLGRRWLASTGPCCPTGTMRKTWRPCLVPAALLDRSKSPPRCPSSVCRSTSKPLPCSPPCLRGK